jgi:anti-sigma regulatory factor (Ser/Thr protein kinase)
VTVTDSLTIQSRFAAIDDARRWVGGHLSGRCDEDMWAVELVLTEALSNVIRHGYGGDETRAIELALTVDGDRLELVIDHAGEPFDPSGRPRPDLAVPREGGYGLHLIEELVDELHQEGTCLRLVKRRWKEQA